MSKVRVRFAPSPTGYLHIGGLRTALYVYLFARKHDGSLVLRIEDTDRTRFVEDAEEDILDGLKWVGIDYDEGPDEAGDYGPYRQSERSELYLKAAADLIESGHAYYAFDSADELASMREEKGTGYNASTRMSMRNSLTLPKDKVAALLSDDKVDRVIRLMVPEHEEVTFSDACRGEITFSTSEVDDQVLIKSDGLPTYHLANVVDDHGMAISHIIRGEDWLSSTPKHVLLYRAFGWEAPAFAHLPLILSPSGGKLSKRKAEKDGIPVFVSDYRRAGYEPEAVINYLALLGWNPGTDQEIFSMSELIDAFTLDRVGTSGVQFDLAKLQWVNEQTIRALPIAEVMKRVGDELAGHGRDEEYDARVVELFLPRISKLGSLPEETSYMYADPESYDEKTVSKKWKGDAGAVVLDFRDKVEAVETFTAGALHDIVSGIVEQRGVGFGKVVAPIRLAVTGVAGGPGLFEIMELIGKEATTRRLGRAVEVLGQE